MINKKQFERYTRQIGLKNFGTKGQKKLLNSKILIIGLGGTASLVVEYLLRMGIGSLSLLDFDKVSASNLHRQLLYTEKDLNKKKIDVLKNYLPFINSSVKINYIDDKITDENIEKIIQGYDFIIDAVDVLKTKFLINKYAIKNNIPYVFSSVSDYKGQVMFVNKNGACLECLLGDYQSFRKEKKKELENKSNFVFPPLIGIASSVITALTVKYILGIDIKENLFVIQENFSVRNYILKANSTCSCQKNEVDLSNLERKV